MRRASRVAVVLLGLAALACSDAAAPVTPPAPSVAVTGIKVTPQVVQFFAIGETKQLVATIVPSNATDRKLLWESTDTTVATVDSMGVVTAKAFGVGVFITAYTHDGRFQSSANASVNQ